MFGGLKLGSVADAMIEAVDGASIMASATPFWCCATPKHLTAKSGMISKP
jgi:hypothetical protein